jgi:uracil-DNA glycosylase family 4
MGRTSPGTREDQRALAQDEIYEHYLSRAISEINELGHELAGRVLGSGHPLADVFLLKHAPGTAELAEGVAFFGRAGQAVLKSVQRLGIDPSLLYGTNCLKSRDPADAEAAPRWLERELAIVQPKIVVAMGSETVSFLNALDLPLAVPVELEVGRVQHLTPTIEVLAVPAIEESLDDQASKRAFWDAFRALGEWHEALPPY